MNIRRPAFPHLGLCVVVLSFFGIARPLAAWDRDVHLALVKAAMGISPAAEEHLPLEFRDVLYKELTDPDYIDKECRYHCADTGAKEPALVAEQLLAQIVSPKTVLKPYPRAQLVGRYLHYVADAVAPASLRRENAPKLLNFFANKDFIFFREKRAPLAAPLSASLRKRAEEMVWANANAEAAYTAMFRLAVNTLADAMLLLPAREGASAPDQSPVWFLVNRMDNGGAGKATEGHYEKGSTTETTTYHSYHGYSYDVTSTWTTWNWDPGSKGGGESFRKLNMLERLGVQLAELSTRQETGRVVLRGLLFNNADLCAEGVGLKAGNWSWSLPGLMPPHSIRYFEAEGPADLLSRRLTNGGKATQCQEKVAPPYVSASRSLVRGNTGSTPNFDYATTPVDLSTKPKSSTVNAKQGD
jgi:hypothetical protein